jgi:serine/threonine-protein kinase
VGRGAFGEVFRAWDPRLDREVALKILDADPSTTDSDVIAEGRLLARVRHPNVVVAYGAERIEGRVGIWTEFVHGRTLEDALHEDGPFPAAAAIAVGVEVCRALAAVHDAGLLHRDIKAQNVMCEDGGRIVLMDLGAGTERWLHDAALDRDMAGTPLYVAPEVLNGGSATPQADLYSVGVLLYHLLTGNFPVRGQSLDEIREAHQRARNVSLAIARPDLPRALVLVIERALDRDPDRRYAGAEALQSALRDATPAAAIAPSPHPSGSRRAWPQTAALAAFLIVIVSGLVLSVRSTIDDPPQKRGSTLGTGRPMPVMRTVSVPPMGLFSAGAPSFDGRLYVNVDLNQDLMVFDLARGTATRLTDRRDSAEMAQFSVASPDGRLVAYEWQTATGGYELRTVDTDGRDMRVLVPQAQAQSFRPIEWSRDGTQIVCTRRSGSTTDVALVDVATGTVRIVETLNGFVPQHLSLSPDNAYIAYDAPAVDNTSRRDIFAVPTEGGPASPLISHAADDLSPVWTPDGHGLFFVSDRSGTFDGWVVPITAGVVRGEPLMVARNLGRIDVAGFTRTGTLYYWQQTGDMDVFTVPIDGAGTNARPQRLASRFAGGNSGPGWSPDGRYFAYISKRPALATDPKAVVVIHDERSNDTREITPALRGVAPVPVRWSPDGRELLVKGSDHDGHAGAFVIRAASGSVTSAVTVDETRASDVGQTRWWLDGRSIAYISPRGLMVRDRRSGVETLVIDGAAAVPPIRITSFDVSSEARALAFTAVLTGTEPVQRVLNVMPLGGTPRELARAVMPTQLYLQSWIPGGQELLLTQWDTRVTVPHELWRVTVSSGVRRDTGIRIPGFTQINLAPVDPSATQVAFTASEAKWDLWAIENFLPRDGR